jgi:gluconolactonase
MEKHIMKNKNTYFLALLLIEIVGSTITQCQAVGLDDLVEADSLERIATGFRFTEGPLWHPDGYLLFSDIPANTIYKWKPDGTVEVFRSPSGYSNSLTFDRHGRLIACEHSNRRVSRTDLDGTVMSLADEYNGSRLNSPNDAVVKSDGSIYFTDPPIGLTAEYGVPGIQELPFQGVYRLLPDGETLELLASDIYQPNGLAFSPDEKLLYVTDSGTGTIYAFDVQTDGLLENKRVFKTISGWPDGIKVDIRGNLYVTTNTPLLQVYSSSGRHLGDITIGARTENCAFGGIDNKTLFITGGTSVYRMQMKVQGSPATSSPDFNGDGIVDSVDVSIMIDHWHTDNALYDIAPKPWGDGIVDVQDLILLSENLFQDVNDPTLAAHWALDETDGMFGYDNAGDNDAVVVGGASWQPDGGQVDGALQLDGVSGYAIAGAVLNPADGPFSILAWIKGGAAGNVIISEPGGANWLSTDPLDGRLMTGLVSPPVGRFIAQPMESESIVTDGQWHRIGFVWDSSCRHLYVDRVEVAGDVAPLSSLKDANNGLYLGAGSSLTSGTFFSGLIDDVRIYNRAVAP